MTKVEQVGGTHYAADYQHWDWAAETQLGYLEGNATKYLSRWRKKNGVQDLRKARSYVEKLLLTPLLPPAGDRRGRRAGLLERFITSSGVIPHSRDAEVIRMVDAWRTVDDLNEVLDAIQDLIDGEDSQ